MVSAADGQGRIQGVGQSDLGSKILAESYSKNTKIAITACKFLKIFRRSMPRTPNRGVEPFLFLNHLQISSAEKKLRLKECGNYTPLPRAGARAVSTQGG